MTRHVRFVILVAFAVLLAAGGAIAADKDRPPLTGNLLEDKKILEAQGWRILDPLGEINTSTCIGDPKTPLCAAETADFCFATVDRKICESVGIDIKTMFKGWRPDLLTRLNLYYYRPKDSAILTAADLRNINFGDPAYNSQSHPHKAGDLALRIKNNYCLTNAECFAREMTKVPPGSPKICRRLVSCQKLLGDSAYVVRKHGDKYQFVGRTTYGDTPPTLWKRK